MKKHAALEINGFNIDVTWWDNHITVQFPRRRVRLGEKGKVVELTMAGVCEVFSRHFEFGKDGEDRTCLKYSKNDGIKYKPGPKKEINIKEMGPRKAIIEIGGHKIRATVSIESLNELMMALPERSVGNDLTFHDLCRAIPEEFELNPGYKATHLRCIKHVTRASGD